MEYQGFEFKVFQAERRELKGRKLSRKKHKLAVDPMTVLSKGGKMERLTLFWIIGIIIS